MTTTPSQTVGPFFSIGLSHMACASACGQQATGKPIQVAGSLFDGVGNPVPDAVLELWQADSTGNLVELDVAPGIGFRGFARVPTDSTGKFQIRTIHPGTVKTLDGRDQAPHIVVLLFMRGLLMHLMTRIYFAGDERNATDPILSLVDNERTSTLLAQPMEGAPGNYHWDIHLQGDKETVFFAL